MGLVYGLLTFAAQVTRDCTSATPAGRATLAAIDVDAARSPTTVIANSSDCDAASPIVVAASAPGLGEVRLSIAVSADAATDGVMAVAAREGAEPSGFAYLQEFVG